MRYLVLVSGLLAIGAPAEASDSLFAQLVEATTISDPQALAHVLSTETLSTSTVTVGTDNRLNGGPMRHGVPVEEIADKLNGCTVKQWRDEGNKPGEAYVLWECPTKRVPENECYFYSYRAAMLDPRYHPANLFIHQMASRDYARCGRILVPPPRL